MVGIGLARDIARKVGAGAFADLDACAEAISLAETVGATETSFVTSPATALALAKVKTGTGSNAPLLGQDATSATSRQILGVPLYVSAAVAANTLWALDRTGVWLVLRDDTTVEADRSIYFTSDRVAAKATMRIGFGPVHPAAVAKLATA